MYLNNLLLTDMLELKSLNLFRYQFLPAALFAYIKECDNVNIKLNFLLKVSTKARLTV
jgi:hypothetical protein